MRKYEFAGAAGGGGMMLAITTTLIIVVIKKRRRASKRSGECCSQCDRGDYVEFQIIKHKEEIYPISECHDDGFHKFV